MYALKRGKTIQMSPAFNKSIFCSWNQKVLPKEGEVGVVVLEGVEVDGVSVHVGQDPVLLLSH